MNLSIKILYLAHWLNITDLVALEDAVLQLCRKNHNSKNLCQSQEPLKKDKFLLLSLGGIWTEEICQLELITKVLSQNLSGKCHLKLLITITIFLYFSMELVNNSIPTVLLLF